MQLPSVAVEPISEQIGGRGLSMKRPTLSPYSLRMLPKRY